MRSGQYELCVEVLGKLRDAGVLKDLVLVGSWCLVLYRDHFKGVGEVIALRTRDMDFLIPSMGAFRKVVDLPSLLGELGFIPEFRGTAGP